jgi:hypothetical protein
MSGPCLEKAEDCGIRETSQRAIRTPPPYDALAPAGPIEMPVGLGSKHQSTPLPAVKREGGGRERPYPRAQPRHATESSVKGESDALDPSPSSTLVRCPPRICPVRNVKRRSCADCRAVMENYYIFVDRLQR